MLASFDSPVKPGIAETKSRPGERIQSASLMVKRCGVCNRNEQNCECELICKSCRLSSEDCQCSDTEEQDPLTREQVPVEPVQPAQVKMAERKILGEPPTFASVKGDRKNLTLYIAALKKWSRVGGVEKKDQAETVMYHASQTCPAYFEELEVKFGETLEGKEEGITEIVKYLEAKFGVSQHSEIVRKLNTFYSCQREKGEDLVDFVSRFEQAYKDCTKLTVAGDKAIITYSETAKAVLLLKSANLSDIDNQIIVKGINFDEKDAAKEKEVFNEAKAAIINHQVTKQANHITRSVGVHKALPTYLVDEEEEDQEELAKQFQDFRIFMASKGKSSNKPKNVNSSKGKRFWKCDYCICDEHPKWMACDCACSNHTKENCPNPDPEKKRLADLREEQRRKKKFEGGGDNPTKKNLTKTCFVQEVSANTKVNQYLKQAASNAEKIMVVKKVKELPDAAAPRSLSEFFEKMAKIERGGVNDLSLPSTVEIRQGYKPLSPPRDQPSAARSPQVPQGLSETATRTFLQGADLLNKEGDTKQHTMIVDTASPSTIIGQDTFVEIKNSYPAFISRTLEYQETAKNFEFGGGEVTNSLARVKLPFYILDKNDKVVLVFFWTEVVEQMGLPFLLGGASLEKVKATITLGEEPSLTLNWPEEQDNFPLYRSQSGHFHLLLMTLSEEDNRIVTRGVMDTMKWNKKEAKMAVNFTVQSDSQREVAELLKRPNASMKVFINQAGTRNDRRPLNKEEIIKLHHFWGHLHPDKLEKIVRNSGRFNQDTIKHIKALSQCEVCAVESRRRPKPKSAAPRSTNFNHLICIDLKENIRYKNSPPYILYIIDSFTNFKAARFISSKKGEVVVEALMLEWIKFFGPPRYIQSDRGKEFLNQHLQTFCSIHGIRMTTTASYTPNANGKIERSHAVLDKMIEKMCTADKDLKPNIALCWAVQASNCLDLVQGISPFTLVFGRNPQHPAMTDPGDPEQMSDVSVKLAEQYRTMLIARETYTSLEAEGAVRKALQARVYTDHTKIQVGDWIYYRTNVTRYWCGPIKVLQKEGKRLYCLKHGSPVVVNVDDVLLHKPEEEDEDPDEKHPLTTVHNKQSSQDTANSPSSDPDDDLSLPSTVEIRQGYKPLSPPRDQPSAARSPQVPQGLSESGTDIEVQDAARYQVTREENIPDIVEIQALEEQARQENSPMRIRPATSTVIDIGQPMTCNHCSKEISSKNVVEHARQEHDITGKSVRSLATMQAVLPDSLYANVNNIKCGDVLVSDTGRYFVLEDMIDVETWSVKDVISKETQNMNLIRDMANMRYIGQLEEEQDEGLNITDTSGQQVFVANNSYTKKIFFAAEKESSTEVAFVVNIPRSRHGEEKCVQAKKKELQDFIDFDVYEIVDESEAENIIATDWVLVEKEKPSGEKVVKARLVMRGDQEKGKHQIPTESPTANKMSIKILLTLAASLGLKVRSNDVTRAFLQTEDLSREVFVRPPMETNLPPGKVWALKRACYGLVDASRAYFLRHARELKKLGFQPLRFDPATFVKTHQGKFQAAYAAHVDDCLTVGSAQVLEQTHDKMAQVLKYGEVQDLPTRYLGMNVRRGEDGSIILDQNHYVKEIEVPDLEQVKSLKKADKLPPRLQSVFRSLASKLNMLALSSRPDYTFAAKFLTTQYGKATKSHLMRAIKLINNAKMQPTEMKIPNLGSVKDWLLVGISDASNKTAREVFSVGGHVVILVNKNTAAASVIHWSSKKIERVVSSSFAAETLALQKATGSLFLARKLLEGFLGQEAEKIECLAITDCSDLWSAIHNMKSCGDNRLQADIINIKQAINDDRTVQELRLVDSSYMLADCLTKQTNLTGELLLNTIRNGVYHIPGGSRLRDSTKTSVKTWHQLVIAEEQEENVQSVKKVDFGGVTYF